MKDAVTTLIIAEAGVNHNGSLKTAMNMADTAKECGADIIKFQTFNTDSLVSKSAKMAEYQKINTGSSQSQKDMLRSLALSKEDFINLHEYCLSIGIQFLSTPFDIDSIYFLNGLQDIWKVPSGEITNYPYLVEIAKTKKPVIMSTGMSTINEISEAIEVLKTNGTEKISLLHCTTEYPTPYTDVNLRVLQSFKDYFKCDIGYSDHTNGIEVSIAAVALGATIIEKHFTLDKNMPGPDHKASLEPHELSLMIRSIRNIETALGTDIKEPTQTEIQNRIAARKSIVAKTHIKKGDIFTELNITTKRPGNGISPMLWNKVIGEASAFEFEADDLIIQ